MNKWYTIQVRPNAEKKFLKLATVTKPENVVNVIVPEENTYSQQKGKRVVTKRIMYPGYVFVEGELVDEKGHIRTSTLDFFKELPGFMNFMGNLYPIPMKQEEVESMLQRSKSEEVRDKFHFEVGTIVKVKSGPFTASQAIVTEYRAAENALDVAISMFGRETKVTLTPDMVEPLTTK